MSLDIHPPQVEDPVPVAQTARERRSPVHFSPGRQRPGELPRLPHLPQHGSAVAHAHTSRSSPPTHRTGRSSAAEAGGVQEALNNALLLRAPDEAAQVAHTRKKRKNARKVLSSASQLLSEARYHGASEAYLSYLKNNPEDERMSRGFSEACTAFKMQEPVRWSRWPFSDGNGKSQRVYTGQKPSQLPPPRATDIQMDSIFAIWDESSPSECVSGYELELSEVNALSGPQKWRKVHRGKDFKKLLKPLGRELVGVRARVRAYNSAGKGEWSMPSDIMRLSRMEGMEKKEIEEIPGAWLHMDLAGIPDLKEDIDPALLGMTKQELMRALHENRTVIKIIFRYYALAGVTQVDDDPSTMTLIQFGNFCAGAGLIDKKLSVSDSDRIFLRAVRSLPPQQTSSGAGDNSLSAAAKATGIKVSKFVKVKAAVGISSLITKGSNLMTQTQFVAALIRIADARYPFPELSLGDKVTRICQDNLNRHALLELQLMNDAFCERYRSRTLQAALVKHTEQLRQIFDAYSKADAGTAAARRTLSTMNVIECHQMFDDAGVFDKAFDVRELLAAFVRVNIEDDLYYQEDSDDTSSELVFDEFEEMVARVFFEAVWVRLMTGSSTADLLDQDGDGDLDDDDVDDLFNECDADNSGSVTLEELTVVLERRLNGAAAKLFADKLMRLADEDGGGTMDRVELGHAVKKMREEKAGGREKPGDMERAFEIWLSSSFLPPAIKAATRKKLLVVEQAPAPAPAASS